MFDCMRKINMKNNVFKFFEQITNINKLFQLNHRELVFCIITQANIRKKRLFVQISDKKQQFILLFLFLLFSSSFCIVFLFFFLILCLAKLIYVNLYALQTLLHKLFAHELATVLLNFNSMLYVNMHLGTFKKFPVHDLWH